MCNHLFHDANLHTLWKLRVISPFEKKKVDDYNEKPLRKVNKAVLVFPEFIDICLSLSELGRIVLTQLRRDI